MSLWLLGGLDPTGGAGVLRDFVTAGAVAPSLPVHCVITAWTRQGHGTPATAEPVSPDRIAAQVQGLPRPRAVKIGLVPAALIDPLARLLEGFTAPIVVDPVLHASDGGSLESTPDSLARLMARATLVTPNLDEAAALTGLPPGDADLLGGVAERFPEVAILLKGGHAREEDCVIDRLWCGGRALELARPRIAGPDPRGTGCALATAIACGLAEGRSIEQAVADGVGWLDRARTRAAPRGGATHLPGE